MADNSGDDVEEPPLTKDLANEEINAIVKTTLLLTHPCHNQAVERHIRLVSEAARTVCTFERRDGLIRQRICSHGLIKKCDKKNNSQQVSANPS